MMGLGKGDQTALNMAMLVSMLDFWGVDHKNQPVILWCLDDFDREILSSHLSICDQISGV